ncbi:hypothetical protein ACG94V_10600 [Acinetobacter sp. ULE_I001]|uniref:hypothetical protein n=1 Tax=Acinetobacter TaxID=469 RepID=UPI0030093BF8
MADVIVTDKGMFPRDVEVCNYPSVTCNPAFKVGNYYIAAPYNFFFDEDHWQRLERTNKVEFLLALRFGMEYDINKFGDGMINKLSFNTMMYVKFQQYVRKHSMHEASKLVAQFQKQTFSIRLKTGFSFFDVLAVIGIAKNITVPETIVHLRQLAENNHCPLYVNRSTFKNIFNEDYHSGMLKQLTGDGTYKGEGSVVDLKQFDNKGSG